jgi:hypothetical protein
MKVSLSSRIEQRIVVFLHKRRSEQIAVFRHAIVLNTETKRLFRQVGIRRILGCLELGDLFVIFIAGE